MDTYGYQDIDYSGIDNVLGGILHGSKSFGEYVGDFIKGGSITYDDVYDGIAGMLKGEISDIRTLIGNILLIMLIASVFIELARTFGGRQVSENGFYVTYMILFIILSVSYERLESMACTGIMGLVDFMKALLPSFLMTVTYVAGEGSLVLYQSALAVIAIVELILLKIFIPAINIYFLFSMINPLLEEDYFSKLLVLLDKAVSYGIKGIVAIVTGIGFIQSIIIPATGSIHRGVLGKLVKNIPAAGDAAETIYQSVYGAGLIVKNSVGVAGLVIIVAICAAPVLRIFVYSMTYQAAAAFSQPLAGDNRMITCISSAAQAARLLLKVVVMAAVLFLFTIGIVIAATGK